MGILITRVLWFSVFTSLSLLLHRGIIVNAQKTKHIIFLFPLVLLVESVRLGSRNLGNGVLALDVLVGLLIRAVVRLAHHVTEVGVDDKLLVVEVLECEPEDDGEDSTGNGGASKSPDEVGILDGVGSGETNGSADGSHEQVDRRDETLHVLGRAGVGDGVASDVDKDLRGGSDDNGQGVEPVRDVGKTVDTLGRVLLAGSGILAARRGLVDKVLEERESDGANGAESEAEGHAGDGAPVDALSAEERVDDMVHGRNNWKVC